MSYYTKRISGKLKTKKIITLHYKYPSAYNYVREVFECKMSYFKTIRSWYRSIDGGPGHNEELYSFKLKESEFKKKL